MKASLAPKDALGRILPHTVVCGRKHCIKCRRWRHIIDFGVRTWYPGKECPRYLQAECNKCSAHSARKHYMRKMLKDPAWRKRRQATWRRAWNRKRRREGVPYKDVRRVPQKRLVVERWWESIPSENRYDAALHGMMSYVDMCQWYARYPEQVPLLNGEVPWIAATLE